MAYKYERDNVAKLCETCIRLANIIDRHGEAGDIALSDEMGLGYLALSGYLRSGVKAIIDMQSELSNAIAYRKSAELNEQDIQNTMVDIFGDEDFNSMNDEDKAKVRAFVQKIIEGWDKKEC